MKFKTDKLNKETFIILSLLMFFILLVTLCQLPEAEYIHITFLNTLGVIFLLLLLSPTIVFLSLLLITLTHLSIHILKWGKL